MRQSKLQARCVVPALDKPQLLIVQYDHRPPEAQLQTEAARLLTVPEIVSARVIHGEIYVVIRGPHEDGLAKLKASIEPRLRFSATAMRVTTPGLPRDITTFLCEFDATTPLAEVMQPLTLAGNRLGQASTAMLTHQTVRLDIRTRRPRRARQKLAARAEEYGIHLIM